MGYRSGTSNTSGGSNIFIGNESGRNNKTGEYNVFMGYRSGYNNDGTSGDGSSNIFIGYLSGYNNTTGKKNSFMGYESGYSNTTGDYNVFIGNQAGKYKSTGWSNVMIGTYSYPLTTTPYGGNYNVMLGNEAGKLNNDNGSVIIGDNAGRESDGGGNVIVGFQSGLDNAGTGNVIAGYMAGLNNAGDNNVIIGITAGLNNIGDNNVLIGPNAGKNASGSDLLYIDNTDTDDPLIYGNFLSDELVINGRTAIGTSDMSTQLHVVRSISGNEYYPSFHTVFFENTSTENNADVLALKIGYTSNPASSNNFITFFKGGTGDTRVGRIEGNGSGGINFVSGSGDYAEYLPIINIKESFEKGDIVGVFGGKISKETTHADFVSAISTNPIVLGNDPGEEKVHLYEKVGFVGIVPVKVKGQVSAGNYIIASKSNDGTGIAISLEEMRPAQYSQIVGIAWESSEKEGVKLIKTAIGISSWTAPLQQQQQQITSLAEQNKSQQKLIEDLQKRIEKLEKYQ
jgi:hypothetical protein